MKLISKRITAALFSLAILGTVFAGSSNATPSPAYAKPTVVVIKAAWCGACQRVDPIIRSLMKEYKGKMNFVILDVTDEAAEARSAKRAKSLGLGSFFRANKRRTSTVAVFNGSSKVFQTAKNYNRSAYVRAFNKALK